MAAGTLALLAFFYSLARHDPKIFFLSPAANAEWIVYPKPPGGSMYYCPEISAEFVKSFVLATVPPQAGATIRAMQRFSLRINGLEIKAPETTNANWKKAIRLDLANSLHPGTNTIAVTVINSNGFPALWFELDAGQFHVASGEDWSCSLLGAAWRPAIRASSHPPFKTGNPLGDGPQPLPSLVSHWTNYLLFALISWVVLRQGKKWLVRRPEFEESPQGSRRWASLLLRGIAALWLILFLNNVSQLYYRVGFDSSAHLNYIDYLKTHWRLPLASDGWEMYQPPLYYLIAAVPALIVQTHGFSADSIQLVRMLGLVIGLAHVTFIFLGVRLLFPKKTGAQLIGLILAAVLPPMLYLSQYITNEGLCAMLATGALYFTLRILKTERPAIRLFLYLGLCLGAALLTKFTAIILLPCIFLALLLRGRAPGESFFRGLVPVMYAAIIALLVSGWHYLRVWRHFGGLLSGNWTGVLGFHYWLENGYSDAGYFFRFGHCLTYPWFSGLQSFGDGLYSTLWGDGCLGGATDFADRAPWNAELMAAGFLLALWPMLIVLAGAVIVLLKLIRSPDATRLLLISVAGSTLAATIYMELQLPYYAQAKAFYGFIAALPFCAFACQAWTTLLEKRKYLAPCAAILFGVWALNSYVSFWIRGWSSETKEITGRTLLMDEKQKEAADYYLRAWQDAPRDVALRKSAAAMLATQGRFPEARSLLASVLHDDPNHFNTRVLLAQILISENSLDQALVETDAAIRIAPDWITGYAWREETLSRLKQFPAAAAAGREGLRINPLNVKLQQATAEAFAQAGDATNAAIHGRAAETLAKAVVQHN